MPRAGRAVTPPARYLCEMAKKLKRNKPTKEALGTGLDALLGGRRLDRALETQPEETVKQLSRDFARLPIDNIHPNPDQPRKDFEEGPLAELANSIRVHGIIQPLTVRHMGDGTYQIISGERRFRASQLAGLAEVPAFVRTANDQTLLEMALIENVQRRDLNPMEIAYSYHRLQEEFNLSQDQLAERIGKPRGTIGNYLNILNASPRVQSAIRDRKISIGAAKTFAGIKDIGQQEVFLDDILSHPNWNVRDIEREAKVYKKKNKATPSRPASDEEIRTVERAFRAFFGTKQIRVSLENERARSGSITIKFGDQDELDQFYRAVE